jgi:hypothetical protein
MTVTIVHHPCLVGQALIEGERRLRTAAKVAKDLHRAAQLADAAIRLQRMRYRHVDNCCRCLAAETDAARRVA